MARFMVIGNPGCRRVELFQAALARAGLPPAALVPWIDLLAGRATLEQFVRPGDVVRIESPGRDFEVEKALIAAGADVPDADGPARISRRGAERLPFDKGRLLYLRQWYLGFRETLRRLGRQLANCPPHGLMNRPLDIEVQFDKCRCQALFARHGVPVPRPLGPVGSHAELLQRMRETGRPRVFVKLAHGSSASGVVAFATSGPRQLAVTTVEMTRHAGELRLYNSRRIRRYERSAEIAELTDALAREGVQVEEWIPKAGLAGQSFDVRVVVIAGRAQHTVVRLSPTPLTNLHLKNHRGNLADLPERMGLEAWEAARQSCERAAALFPDSLYTGIDLVIAAGFRRHAIVESNAFGDLLPELLWEGRDTYAAEIEAALAPSSLAGEGWGGG